MTPVDSPVCRLYSELLKRYGPQGWWPQTSHPGSNPTKRGAIQGYHPGDYGFPRNEREKFEVCVGSILTQNTAWTSVEKALNNLVELEALTPDALLKVPDDAMKEAIRPAGYHNQKSRYLREFTRFFIQLGGATPSRDQLLGCRGIGPETADSMLLYGYRQPQFKVDAYTGRILSHLGLIEEGAKYGTVKSMLESELSKRYQGEELVEVYQEYHALIVEHAKRFYSRKPYGKECPLTAILG